MGNKELQNDTKKIESEVKDICDLGESIALEARNEGISQGINQGKQMERKENNRKLISNLMSSLNISFSKQQSC